MYDLLDKMSPLAYIAVIKRMRAVMTIKEISAWVMVISAIAVSAWIAWDARTTGVATSLSAAAWKMLWAIGWSIGLNIVAVIIGVIAVSIVQREEVKDERADERDKL